MHKHVEAPENEVFASLNIKAHGFAILSFATFSVISIAAFYVFRSIAEENTVEVFIQSFTMGALAASPLVGTSFVYLGRLMHVARKFSSEYALYRKLSSRRAARASTR